MTFCSPSEFLMQSIYSFTALHIYLHVGQQQRTSILFFFLDQLYQYSSPGVRQGSDFFLHCLLFASSFWCPVKSSSWDIVLFSSDDVSNPSHNGSSRREVAGWRRFAGFFWGAPYGRLTACLGHVLSFFRILSRAISQSRKNTSLAWCWCCSGVSSTGCSVF